MITATRNKIENRETIGIDGGKGLRGVKEIHE